MWSRPPGPIIVLMPKACGKPYTKPALPPGSGIRSIITGRNLRIPNDRQLFRQQQPIIHKMFFENISAVIDSPFQWTVLMVCAILIGMSKTGMQGINTISIPLLAIAFGAKPSTGLILPMLCFADLIAVVYYRRSAEWKYILKLLPAAVAGFGIALLADRFVPADQFRLLLAACIFAGLIVMWWTERRGGAGSITAKWWYSPAFGLLGGFTTMIGNAAGPVMSIYLLSMKLPKLSFVGTAAWFFLIVNYLKLPLQAFVWDNITSTTLAVNLLTVPAIFVGAVAGIALVKRFPERSYHMFIIVMTIISTVMLLF